ncbi:MAG TPA: hypothetical protein DCP90_05290 [Clostridiales bacterium]|nr:MAG: hypothetical protein A2Y22_08915 [Clostridiales bacterium GWD2_32_59]HAN10014.1 hypothetical protein [Clostridiales bacterium]
MNSEEGSVDMNCFKVNILIILLVECFIFTGCNEKKFNISGTIETVQIDINSEVQGKITKVLKEEGDSVQEGEIVAIVDSENQKLLVKSAEENVKLKELKLLDIKAGTRKEQIKQAEAQVKAARTKLDELKHGTRQEEINKAQIAVNTAKISYDYLSEKYEEAKKLHETNAISNDELAEIKYKFDTSLGNYNSAIASLELLKNGPTKETIKVADAGVEQAVANLELLKSGSTVEAIKMVEAELESSKILLEQAKLVLSRYEIKSQVRGTLVQKNLEIGDIVNMGTNIGTVSDLSNMFITTYVTQRNLGLVKVNDEVTLKSNLNPKQIIKGKITYISSEAEYTPKNTETSEAKENTVFKIKVEVLDNIEKLRPGMTLDVILS